MRLKSTAKDGWRAQACVWALALCGAAALAQETVLITGNPWRRDVGAEAASSLSGDALARRLAGTLGDTLDGLPGVSASGFGPNSSRPVIRGLDGDRVRVLDNGGASVDASNLSFDHAVALDPLVVERLEVLRGPAALLYGGNATGGVVNAIDNRIPRLPALGLSGRAQTRLGGASNERAAALVLDGGAAGLAWHVDAVDRRSADQRVPRFTPMEDGQALPAADRVRNSASRSHAGAVGAGWVGDAGYLGLAVDTVRNRYGVTVEPDVTIRLARDRVALGGEFNLEHGFVRQLQGQASSTRYQHQELEGSGAVGTTFASRGHELRLQMRHQALAGWQGVWGVQAEQLRFSALGEEAFVPGTRTTSQALFALEEQSWGAWTLSGGARWEQVQVSSDGGAQTDPQRFGPASHRRFQPISLSLSASLALPAGWQLQATLGRTQRAPAYYELYANGVHLATAAYERGDPQAAVERSRHAELGLAWKGASSSFKANLFDTRFANFIALEATGRDITVGAASPVPEYQFAGVRARLRGLESEGRMQLLDAPWPLQLTAGLDLVHGEQGNTHEPLPRLPPTRARLGLEWGPAAWRAGLDVRRAARQSRVGRADSVTAASTLTDLWARGSFDAAGTLGWFAKLGNFSNQLAYNAVAVATVRGLSPLPGRSLSLGLNARW